MQAETSNINTYLKYAKEFLAENNYNEVDAMILAQLSYVPYELIFKNYTTIHMSMRSFVQSVKMFEPYYENCSEEKRVFIENLSYSKRFANCTIHHLRTIATEETQWAAFTMDIGKTDTAVIAMRGTDGTAVGWAENFMLGYNVMGTGAQLAAFRYLKETKADKIFMTGHSKGGSNISSAYVMSNPQVRDKIVRIDNFDGPGVNPEFAENYRNGYEELRYKMYNFYPQDSIIGLLLEDNPGRVFYVKTEVRERYAKTPIWGQHDPFAFVVKGTKFAKTQQSCTSYSINKILDYFMKKTTNHQRYQIIRFLEYIRVPALIAGHKKRIVQK